MPPSADDRGKPKVVVSMADAARDLARQKRRRDDPAPEKARNGCLPNRKNAPPNWTANSLGLPNDDPCPVVPLGTEKSGGGVTYHMIDSNGQFVSYSAKDFSHAGMQSLFAVTPNYPAWAWPRHGRPFKITEGEEERTVYPISSFEDDDVRQALMMACTRRGLFSPTDKLRGRGMWLTKAGGLIYHAGEELWEWDDNRGVARSLECGLHEGYLYARHPGLPAPWPAAIGIADNPVRELYATLRGPNWTRGDVDPLLLLGWIAAAFLGGALDWRPAVLLLGGFGTGKSTLQEDLQRLFGDALFDSANTSAAGIYQNMAHDTRPIALDESEPDGEHSKIRDVIKLMRVSSSGGKGRRGSSGGVGSEFQLRSAFLFGAINNPLQSSQDLSRVAILRLQELSKAHKQGPPINIDTCGRMVLGLLMREWPRFHQTRNLYMKALQDGGHTARGQKTYGTLLAGADLLLGAELADELGINSAFTLEGQDNSDGLEWWSKQLAADELPEVEDAKQNWRKCLHWLLTNQVEQWRSGGRNAVGQLMAELKTRGPSMLDEATTQLGSVGLGLRVPGDVASIDDGWVLAVPNDHALLRRLFRDSDWEGGGWKDALRQCPKELGVMITDRAKNKVTIGGEQERCTLVVMGRYHKAPER